MYPKEKVKVRMRRKSWRPFVLGVRDLYFIRRKKFVREEILSE